MNADKAKITGIFNNATLVEIPFFQRTYVWNEDLWERFLEDMEYVSQTKKTHFLGSIILKEGKKPSSEDKFTARETVVDGQQRLTTFLIFLRVLCLKQGQDVMFNYQFRISGEEIALRHGKNDVEAFEKVMNLDEVVKIDNPYPESRIISAYNYFVEHVDEKKLNLMPILSNVLFVKIDLNSDEDEQQIFDTINSLGVNLTTSELLKNYFFNRDTIDEYEKKWESVFEKDQDAKVYWDTTIETGRVRRALIDIFFDAYLQLFVQDKKYNVSNEDKMMYDRVDQIAQSYQHFINHYCNGDKNVVLAQMKDYAACFRQTFNPNQCNMSIPAVSSIERLNVIIFGLKSSTLIPYVLYITKNVFDTEELNKMYGIIESFIMRRMVVQATTKNYNRLFISLLLNETLDSERLIARLTVADDPTTYFPTDEELKHGFMNSRLVNLQTRGILYLIESHIRPDNSSTALLGFSSYSLEHLMPKKWRNNWDALEDADAERKRDLTLLTLGNLAIITQSLNSAIRDGNWETKKEGKGPNKPGLKLCASGLSTMHDVLDKDKWDEELIGNRGEWLYLQAVDLWKMQ